MTEKTVPWNPDDQEIFNLGSLDSRITLESFDKSFKKAKEL